MRRIKLADHVRAVEARKAELGLTGRDFVLRNSGIFRTAAKRALLKALAKIARDDGRDPPFKAEY